MNRNKRNKKSFHHSHDGVGIEIREIRKVLIVYMNTNKRNKRNKKSFNHSHDGVGIEIREIRKVLIILMMV